MLPEFELAQAVGDQKESLDSSGPQWKLCTPVLPAMFSAVRMSTHMCSVRTISVSDCCLACKTHLVLANFHRECLGRTDLVSGESACAQLEAHMLLVQCQ